jgi:hypothetical protein
MRHTSVVFAALFAACCSSGCASGPKTLPAAKYNPSAMADAVLREYDRDGSGSLEGAELDACPGLKAALAGIDTNRDGSLSRDELVARFGAYQAAGTVSVPITVTLDGNPLADATLTFTPESCMDPSVKAATARTDETGAVASYEATGTGYAGLHAGLYRVAISKPDEAGNETLPARYNAQTTLGCEVFGGRGSSGVNFKLTSGR